MLILQKYIKNTCGESGDLIDPANQENNLIEFEGLSTVAIVLIFSYYIHDHISFLLLKSNKCFLTSTKTL